MAANNAKESIITTIGEREFEMERIFDAPRELVFKAFTQSEHVARWWAPGDYTIPVCKIDLRPKGIWHYCMRSPKGEDQWVKAVYNEIVELERIVYTCTFADKDANSVDDVPVQLATVTFTEYEGKTKLNIRFQFETAEDLKTTLDMGMIEGLSDTLNNNLVRLLKEIQN